MALSAQMIRALLVGSMSLVLSMQTKAAGEDARGPVGIDLTRASSLPGPAGPASSPVSTGYRSLHFESSLSSGFVFPFHITADGDNFFVSDATGDVVQQFQITASGVTYVRTFGTPGAGAGQLNGPEQVAVIGNDIYVADFSNNRVQRFNKTSGAYVSQFGSSGSGPGQFSSPSGLIFNPANGLLYVSDVGNDRIQTFTTAGVYQSQFGSLGTGNGQLNNPYGLAVDSAGNIYAADSVNNRVVKFNAAGTWLRNIAVGATSPFAVTVDRADVVWLTFGAGDIYSYDSNGGFLSYYYGSYGSPSTASSGYLSDVRGIAVTRPLDVAPFYGNSAIIVADGSGMTVQLFSTSLQATAHPQVSAIAGVGNFTGQVAFDSAENIYFTSLNEDKIYKYSKFGNFITQWGSAGTGNGQFDGPYGIAIDDSDDVYIVDNGNNRVQKFNANGGYLLQFGSLGAGNGQFNHPAMITTDGSWLYVTDEVNHRVQKFSFTGAYVRQWGTSGSGNGQMFNPAGIAVDRARSQVYVADFTGNRIQQFSVFGDFIKVLTDSTSGSGTLAGPRGLATDQHGNLYVTDGTGSGRVVQFNDNGTYLGNFAATAANGIGVDTRNGQIHVGSIGTDGVRRFGTTSGKSDTIGLYRPSTRTFLLRGANSPGSPTISASVVLATADDVPLTGDWNGDGIDTPGLYRPSTSVFYLWNRWRSLSLVNVDHVISYGVSGDRPIVGDWNGDGKDGIGVFHPASGGLFLRNRLDSAGISDYSVAYNAPYGVVATDLPVAGDWNQDGVSSTGFYRPVDTHFYVSNRNTSAAVSVDGSYLLGSRTDRPVTGDWNHAGFSGLGAFRPSTGTFYLKYDLDASPANLVVSFDGDLMFHDGFQFGAGDLPLGGNWGSAPE